MKLQYPPSLDKSATFRLSQRRRAAKSPRAEDFSPLCSAPSIAVTLPGDTQPAWQPLIHSEDLRLNYTCHWLVEIQPPSRVDLRQINRNGSWQRNPSFSYKIDCIKMSLNQTDALSLIENSREWFICCQQKLFSLVAKLSTRTRKFDDINQWDDKEEF